jgi:predicted phage terminase large subunit-like protein
MPTLDQLASQLQRRNSTFNDFVKQIFDPQTAIGNYRSEQLKAARESLVDFAQLIFPQHRINWHHRVIGRHLEQLARGEFKRLMVLTPPRCAKTTWCSHLFPAWCLGRQDEYVVSCAYNITRVSDEAKAVKAIFENEAYRAIFPLAQIPRRTNELRNEVRKATQFNLVSRPKAVYRAAGIGGGLTGYDKTIGIIDDPIKSLEEAYSEKLRDKNWSWYSSVFRARDTRTAADSTRGIRDLLVQTPWHEDDMAGRIQEKEGKTWHILRLPAFLTDTTFEDKDPDDTRAIDESLWPEQWPKEALLEVQKTFPTTFQALFQCRPSSAEGSLFHRSQFDNCRYGAHDVPVDGFYQLSVDANFGTENETSSYVAVQLWCFTPNGQALLIRAWQGHWTFPRTLAQIEAILSQHPNVDEILVEEKANGNAIVQMLKHRVRYPFTTIRPTESKMVRAIAIAPWIEAGSVFVPKEESPWLEEFLTAICAFPRGKSDDAVDAMSQALRRLNNNPNSDLAAWGNILGINF